MTNDARGGAARGTRNPEATWGRRVPVVLFLLALAMSGYGALEAYSAARSHEETTRSLLEDYGGFAAFTYQRRSSQLLSAALDQRLAITRSNQTFRSGQATEECLMLILDETGPNGCGCSHPIAGAYSFFTGLGDGPTASKWAGDPPAEDARAEIVAAVRRHAREEYGEHWLHALMQVRGGDRDHVVAYTLVVTPIVEGGMRMGRDSVVYGLEVDRARLADVFAEALADEILLPPSLTRSRPNDEVIAVEVLGPDGEVLFASRPGTPLAFPSRTDQHAVLGGGAVRASILPEVADQLIIGGLPRNRTPFFVLLFGLAGGLAVLAILQLRKEDRLVLLRQDFVASVSHELRTPLAQVRLFTETLRLGRTRTDDERDWALENIDRESTRLSNLVDNILRFSRSERGVHSVHPEPGDLAVTMREAIASFDRLIPAEKAHVEVDLPDRMPAEVDPDSMRRVVLNLLDNALRYGPPGQVIRVRGSTSDDGVRVAVEDEGPGVPVADREHVFQPFWRGQQSLGTVVVGSGIGLSVVREIVSAHGGRVWAEASPAGGARFAFELPVLHTAREAPFAPATRRTERATGAA